MHNFGTFRICTHIDINKSIPDKMLVQDIKEKGLSGEEVYDRATWRRVSSYIDPHKSGNKMKRKMLLSIQRV